MIEDLSDLVSGAVKDVFTTMLEMNAKPEPPDSLVANGEPHVAGSVGFIGKLNGVVYLYASATFARRIASRMLRLSDAEIKGNEMVNDVVGEVSNMVVGNIKSRLCDRGLSCALTIPSIVRGSHFTIEPVSSTERKVITFRCDEHQLVVEILIKAAKT